jgi:stage II sporulation protein AB (anti-sigma F factor)
MNQGEQIEDVSVLELTLAAIPENIPVARQAVSAMVSRRADPEFAGDVSTALTEAAMNAVVHGYPNGGGEFHISARFEGTRLCLEVRDWGSGIQPRPATSSTGLRIGLPLIAALTDEFEVRSGPNSGTLVKMFFDLERQVESEAPAQERPDRAEGETVLRVESGDGIAPSVASALAMIAARVDLSVDRVADVQVMGDLLGSAIADEVDKMVALRISEHERGLVIKVGPFSKDEASKVVERCQLPALGNVFDSLADEWRVEPNGVGEMLVIVVGEAS